MKLCPRITACLEGRRLRADCLSWAVLTACLACLAFIFGLLSPLLGTALSFLFLFFLTSALIAVQ